MTTNIPSPTFTDKGFVSPSAQQTLTGAQEDLDSAFGGGLNPALNTPQGQLATSWASSVDNKNNEFVGLTNQFDPATNFGRWQDGIARVYFITRKPSLPTVVSAVCGGGQGVPIPAGSLARAEDGNIYTCTDGGTIDASGEITLSFTCNVLGPIACPAGSLNFIYQAIPGWDTIENPADGVLGQNVESPQQFEARRAQTVAGNARNTNEAVLGAVLNITNVLDAYVVDNELGSNVTKGGVTLLPHSIFVCAAGGSDADVAQGIWSKKSPGCNYNGNTTVVVSGSSTLYSPPVPTWSVTFQRPFILPILFVVNMLNNALVPSSATVQVQNAIIAAFAGADGGTRARIGSTILGLRYASPIIQLGSWAQLLSIRVGSLNMSASAFTGVIVGTALTVSSVTGTIAVGQTISDNSLTPSVLPGTKIVSGAGTAWVVSISQNVASTPMIGAVANLDDVVVNINQVPTINAGNIQVNFS